MPVPTSNYYQPRVFPAAKVESTPPGEQLPVVVVGAGPVGLATALGLGLRGVKVSVVDSGTGASYGSRATCYSRHTVEICERLGYAEAFTARGLPWTGGRSYYHDREVLQFQMPVAEHNVRPPMFNIGQCEYEDIQLGAIEKCDNVTMLWGTTLKDLSADAEGVTLVVDSAEGERTLRAGRVVASDGGRSKVRDILGLKLQGNAYEGRYVIADIHWKSPLPIERKVWFDPPSNPTSTIIMHKQPDNIWRIDYQLVDGDDAAVETTKEAIIARITKHLSWLEGNGTITKEPWTLEWHSYYKALALSLDSFVAGHDRVVFAGDAAHLVPIFGVRGLNSGMEDADTLAWMLAAVVHGDADPKLLHAYSDERHDAWKQNIAAAGKSTLIMTPGTEGYRTTRDALLNVTAVMPEYNHLINPRQSSATHAVRSPLTVASGREGLLAGEPIDDRKITINGTPTSLNAARGLGFAVYSIAHTDAAPAEAVAARIRAALPHERVTVVPLAVGADNGAIADWRAEPGEVVVVRPDGITLARGLPAELPALESLLTADKFAARSEAVDRVLLTPEQAARELTWLQLSEALDAVEDKHALLAQLALVLGADAGPERVAQVIKKLRSSEVA